MALIGYARVSSNGQSLSVQKEKLKHCAKIYEEKRSGLADLRPELTKCLDYLRDGDTLVVTKLDRLARSTHHLCQIADRLACGGVQLQVLDQAIDTSAPAGRLLFHMLSAIAEFEAELRAERQSEGVKLARERGVTFGRRRALSPAQVAELRARRQAGISVSELMRDYDLAKATVYRYLDGVHPAPSASSDV